MTGRIFILSQHHFYPLSCQSRSCEHFLLEPVRLTGLLLTSVTSRRRPVERFFEERTAISLSHLTSRSRWLVWHRVCPAEDFGFPQRHWTIDKRSSFLSGRVGEPVFRFASRIKLRQIGFTRGALALASYGTPVYQLNLFVDGFLSLQGFLEQHLA